MLKSCAKLSAALIASLSLALAPAAAQSDIESIDPNSAIDADLDYPDYDQPAQPGDSYVAGDGDEALNYEPVYDGSGGFAGETADGSAVANAEAVDEQAEATYADEDLIGAAEGVFGKGAKGLAEVIEDILSKQGQPNAYIAGREAGGAFVVGLRYGSGKLYHKIEGERDVYWTGPSVGFDVGGNAAKSFVLVYNLYDTEELFQRFPAGEGAAYFVGGFHVSYLRAGDKVLIPVRLGAGLRLGANVGYMKFSKKQNWLPF